MEKDSPHKYIKPLLKEISDSAHRHYQDGEYSPGMEHFSSTDPDIHKAIIKHYDKSYKSAIKEHENPYWDKK